MLRAQWFHSRIPDLSEEAIDELVNSSFTSSVSQPDPSLTVSELDKETASSATNPLWTKYAFQFGKTYAESVRNEILSTGDVPLPSSYHAEIECTDDDLVVKWIPEHAGTYSWRVFCDGIDVSPDHEEIVVDPDAYMHLNNSVLYGYGAKYAIAGEKNHFIVQVRLNHHTFRFV